MTHIKKDTHLHFVGIGGIGMSGIAEVFLNQGYSVSGSDVSDSDTTRRLKSLGVRIFPGHEAENVHGASVVVISSAIRPTNLELIEAKRLRIPVIPRAEMLGELMRGKVGIAVAGTHGKTTTTSMLASILMTAGLDPTLVVGGKVDSLGGNAKLGQGQFVVAEADESDGSFLHLPATFGIVTNIDNDHLDHYQSVANIEAAFLEFVGQLPFYGVAAVCADDPGVHRCLESFTKPFLTYGFAEERDFVAKSVETSGFGSRFQVYRRDKSTTQLVRLGQAEILVPGRHNVLNALASIVIATRLDVPFETIARGLKNFRGVKRRFEIRWQDLDRRRLIVDDYGHHPTEIAATITAAKSCWPGRIVTVFQPHRYSRTQNSREQFLSAFAGSDLVLMTDIYAAGEDPIAGVTTENLVRDISKVANPSQKILHTPTLERAKAMVLENFTDGDLILCLGAGSITRLPDQIIESLS